MYLCNLLTGLIDKTQWKSAFQAWANYCQSHEPVPSIWEHTIHQLQRYNILQAELMHKSELTLVGVGWLRRLAGLELKLALDGKEALMPL